jgi:GntR family transcriptional regulator
MPAARQKSTPVTPRYIAIAGLVRDRIVTDRLGPHTLLPSERELA